jgi:prophage DNA circulation protein
MDKLEMMILSAETEVEQKNNNLQAAIKRLVELVHEDDITNLCHYNAYIVQAEDVRRYANEVMMAKRVCETLKKIN